MGYGRDDCRVVGSGVYQDMRIAAKELEGTHCGITMSGAFAVKRAAVVGSVQHNLQQDYAQFSCRNS